QSAENCVCILHNLTFQLEAEAPDLFIIEDPQPVGPGWLFHSKTMGNYLSLLSSSQREETQEACCGALQNLTTHEGISTIMGQTIVQKLGGLRVIGPLLNSKKVNLQRNTVALLGNLTKNPVLHSAITTGANESDDILSMACQASSCLLMKNPEMNKNLLNSKLINSLNDISKNM
uniref:Uncharacterized protein n=1 Tax=Amphilophus citrinellus TaxID=61819 RepID=A0A3Q0RKZ6_AMPCI